MAAIAVRRVRSSDEGGLTALAARVVDGGAVAFTNRRHVPWLEAASADTGADAAADVPATAGSADSAGFIAESGSGEIVGAGWVRIGRCRLHGTGYAYALLHSLSVAPECRRQGVARALTDARLDWVDSQSSGRAEPVIPIATIQRGNDASLANARRWATMISGDLRVTPVPVRSRPPRAHPGWQLSTPADLPPFGEVPGFGPDTTPEAIRCWLAQSVRGQRVNHLHVLVDRSGSPLAALGVHDETPVSHMQIVRMPRSIALVNRVVPVVGRDRTIRVGQVALTWNRDAAAGRYLWQHVRWHWRERLTNLVTTIDPADPLGAMTAAPRWVPTTRISLAIRLPAGLPSVPGPIRLPL